MVENVEKEVANMSTNLTEINQQAGEALLAASRTKDLPASLKKLEMV